MLPGTTSAEPTVGPSNDEEFHGSRPNAIVLPGLESAASAEAADAPVDGAAESPTLTSEEPKSLEERMMSMMASDKRKGKQQFHLDKVAGATLEPLPDGVDANIPGIMGAWLMFQRVDEDKSGRLECDEICTLARELGLDWNRRQLKKAYAEMGLSLKVGEKGVSFVDFALWWARQRAIARREMRRTVKELFEEADRDKSGILDKEEFALLLARANKDSSLPSVTYINPDGTSKQLHFNLDTAWKEIKKVPFRTQAAGESHLKKLKAEEDRKSLLRSRTSTLLMAEENDGSSLADREMQRQLHMREGEATDGQHGLLLGVSLQSFESWWKAKVGIAEPEIPVLPEFMVQRINDKVEAAMTWNAALKLKTAAATAAEAVPQFAATNQRLSSHSNWWQAKEKVKALMGMQKQWGYLQNIYETQNESIYEEEALPTWIRDPDSAFSAFWDLASVAFLVYVTITVPLRACFGIEIILWSAAFMIDLVIDIYFIVDVCLNLRTSYYDANGFREHRPAKIAVHYMKGWFCIDLISCLPIGYVQYFYDDDSPGGDNFRGVKALRLLKMTKLLRLARIKRILERHNDAGSDVSYQQIFNIMLTIFTIIVLVHLMACFNYLIGETNETLANGVVINGWIEDETDWWTRSRANGTVTLKPDPSITLLTKYAASICYALSALDHSTTSAARGFAVGCEFLRDIILGLVASLITTISMSMSSDDDATNMRLQRLRGWMKRKRLPKGFQRQAMAHFQELWTNQSDVDLPKLLDESPPAMASNLSNLLYGRVISTVPLFKGLSTQVICALCVRCRPLIAMKFQTIIRQGEPGKEMYIILSGEVEVSSRNSEGVDLRLGFLSEGAFFGEAPVLADRQEGPLQLRMRTVRAVTTTELTWLARDDVHSLCSEFPELQARVLRFRNSHRVMNNRTLRKIDISRLDMNTLATRFKRDVHKSNKVRAQNNLASNAYVPNQMHKQIRNAMTTVTAVQKFKEAGIRYRRKTAALAAKEEHLENVQEKKYIDSTKVLMELKQDFASLKQTLCKERAERALEIKTMAAEVVELLSQKGMAVIIKG